MNIQGKKFVKAGIALSLLTSTLLHATNGDTLIGTGAKARGMAGAGIALSQGAESALMNPALITSVKNTQISFGGTIFMPDVTLGGMKSAADMNVIPEVSIANKIDENWYVGVGMWGTAGMGVDYRDYGMPYETNLQLMQFGVPIAYKSDKLSVAIAPIMQYGSLTILMAGAGASQDFGFGVSAGMTYDITDNLTFGAVYKSAIGMTYDYQITSIGGASDKLEQPAEYGVGLAYTMGEHTFALDLKKIKWGSANGYKDFLWEDQDVVAVGYEYNRDNYTLRAGYNHASSPIPVTGTPIDGLNFGLFPAVVESHYAVGGTYRFSDRFSVDLAYVHAAEKEVAAVGLTHSQDGLSFQMNWDF